MNVRLAPILVAAALAAAAPASFAGAQTRPAPQHVVARGFTDRTDRAATPHAQQLRAAEQKTEHVLYGRIDAVRGNLLQVRARGGRLLTVDASQAIASGRYSAPLFVGKLVLVTGVADAAHTIHADSITREARIDEHTAADR